METVTATMRVAVRLFARYREAAGVERVVLAVPPGARVGDLWPHLLAHCPGLAATGQLVDYSGWAVNEGWARPATALHDGDEVALIPPVSGG